MPDVARRSAGTLRESDVVLDGMHLKIASPDQGFFSPIREELVNIAGRKVNQGPPGPDDDPINDSWIVESWLGGGQKGRGNPATSLERFDWAEALTEYAENLTLPLRVRSFDRPAGFAAVDPIILGDFPMSASTLYAAWNADIGKWDEGTQAWVDSTHNLTNTARYTATIYTLFEDSATLGVAGTTLMFVPQGSTYSVYDGSANATEIAVGAIDFSIWDEKLFRLDLSGNIDWTSNGEDWNGLITRIPDGSTPRRLLTYKDAQGEPALYVVTDTGFFVVDYDFQRLVRPDAHVPRHPFAGTAATVFRQSMYVNSGIGIHEYQPGSFRPVGVDRDQSIPEEFRGYVKDMVPEYNGMFALITGNEAPAEEETALLDMGGGDAGPVYVPEFTSNVLLMLYNTFGWHYRWKGGDMTATNLYVSQSDGAYRLWWGAGSKARYVRLPITYYNPADSPDFEYEETGFLETSDWDWGWKGQLKLAKTIELEAENLHADGDDSITVYVSFDGGAYSVVGTITTNGEHHFHLGLDSDLTESYGISLAGDPNEMLYRGIVHDRIKLKFELRRKTGDANATRHPIIKWHKVTSRKLMRVFRSWRVAVDLSEDVHKEWTAGEVIERINRIVRADEGFEMVVPFVPYDDDRVFMVEIVSADFDRSAGDSKAFGRINLIESKDQLRTNDAS